MQVLREPPYPASTKAKGWRFELDYEAIGQSDTWALAPQEIRPWLLMMWLTAWREIPCGSLPVDRRVIAAKMGMPADLFEAHHEVLLRGWWLAEDGRMYHPTIARRVEEMIERRGTDAERQARRRAAQKAAALGEAEVAGLGGPPPGPDDDVTRDNRRTSAGLQGESDTGTSTRREIPSPPNGGDSSTGKAPGASQQGQKVKTQIPACPYQRVIEVFHQTLPELPSIRVVDDARERAIKRVWAWVFTSRKADGSARATDIESALAWFRNYFELARSSDFLMGRSRRSPGHENWRCTLDYLMSHRGLKHVIETLQ